MADSIQKNVFGRPLQACCFNPVTGFFRDGFCHTSSDDHASHTVCARVTQEFLIYSASRGNNLMPPVPSARFPGLKPGDFWCLCVHRWYEAYEAGVAPMLKLESTHEKALNVVSLDILLTYSLEIAENTPA